MIVLISLLIIALIGWTVIEIIVLIEQGLPAKDSDILEMLVNCQGDFYLEKKYNDKFKLRVHSLSVPSIHQTQYTILFPYYISGVGVIPIWYKSASKFKKIFGEKISASNYKITKRDRLGLN